MARRPTAHVIGTRDAVHADVRAWLNAGGRERLREAMSRAEVTSDQFAWSTRVRPETLTDPVTL